VGSGGDELRVDPAVLAGACESLSGAAQSLLGQLKSLDGTVSGMLARWHGLSGGAYGQGWGQWLQGAREVESALEVMATLLGDAGKAYEHRDREAASDLGACGNG
jgi:WXG100 family type VII secretion target